MYADQDVPPRIYVDPVSDLENTSILRASGKADICVNAVRRRSLALGTNDRATSGNIAASAAPNGTARLKGLC